MLYITFLVLIYLVTGSLYLLATFILFPLPPPPTFGSQKSDLIFLCIYLFLKYDWLTTLLVLGTQQWFCVSIYFKMISMISLVVFCHHAKTLHNYWLYSLHCTFIPMTPNSFWQPPVCSLYLLLFLFDYVCSYVLFLDSTHKWNHTVFVWFISLRIIHSRSIHVVA